jgi:hypothetical protein
LTLNCLNDNFIDDLSSQNQKIEAYAGPMPAKGKYLLIYLRTCSLLNKQFLERKTINSQAREYIIRLQNYFKRERDTDGPLLPLSKVNSRTADALQISEPTLSKIVLIKYGAEGNKNNILKSPGKNRKRRAPITGEPYINEAEIRKHIIYNYYEREEIVTIKKLHQSLKDCEKPL